MYSFVYHSSLLTVSSVGLVVACNDFLCVMETVHIFHNGAGTTIITEMLVDSFCCISS